jgi:hypothetical protein
MRSTGWRLTHRRPVFFPGARNEHFRIVTPNSLSAIVQSVGVSTNGRPLRALVFVGRDLYLASKDSLSVIRNAVATTCQGGCNAAPVAYGFSGLDHVGMTTDGINRLYLAVNDQVWRFTISNGAVKLVANSGTEPNLTVLPFAFVGGHTNLLQLDRLGNLWIGDDPSDGAGNFQGQAVVYLGGSVVQHTVITEHVSRSRRHSCPCSKKPIVHA